MISLLHDATESILPQGHGEVVASLLAPYISPQAQWVLHHHEVFQGFYYFHHFDADTNRRDALRASPHWNVTARWCEIYDQASFDPAYPSLPLEYFRPALRHVLAKSPYWWDPTHLKRGVVTG